MGPTKQLVSLYREAPRKSWLLRSAVAPVMRWRIRSVVSADRTRLAVRRSGTGDPVVLVHGGLGSMDTAFRLVEPALADHHEVWSYDRRGRGRSGDGPDYCMDREVDDLVAVLEAVGGPAHVVAHSFGALCALLAARRGAPLRSLVLYEPPFNQYRLDESVVARITEAVERGEVDRALETFYEVADVPRREVRLMRSTPPLWRQLRRAVHTLPRELAAISGWVWEPGQWSLPDVPVLLIGGSETSDPVFPTLDELMEAFPHAEAELIEGQRHLAMGFEPWRFVESVLGFTRKH